MIATAKDVQVREAAAPDDDPFLSLLPIIRREAGVAFRGLPAEVREEMIAEVVANAFVAHRRLVKRGKANQAFATPLARYAIAQARSGRRTGTKLNVRDVSSPYAQCAKRINVERLDRYVGEDRSWMEIVVEDRQAGPAEIAATRIDFQEWLGSLPGQARRVAIMLASGETTKDAAHHFELSPGRISQFRRELKESWEAFHGPRLATPDR